MPKPTHKRVKFSPEEMAADIPPELDFTKLRHVGDGPEIVRRLAERSKHVVGLDPDVAKVFPDAEAVNTVLRAIIMSLPRESTRKRKKSA